MNIKREGKKKKQNLRKRVIKIIIIKNSPRAYSKMARAYV